MDKKEYIERGAFLRKCAEAWGHYGVTIKAIEGIADECAAADVVVVPKGGLGELSDGYHTFNELYHHRAILFSVICNSIPDKAWKSKLHDTGDMFDGMFIVGIETPEGQATYHYDIEPYWEMFKVKELEKAPKWDGHTPKTAIERISKISADVVEVRHGEWKQATESCGWHDVDCVVCSACGESWILDGDFDFDVVKDFWNYCPNCGARMDGERKEQT
jgi:hypothetical protein